MTNLRTRLILFGLAHFAFVGTVTAMSPAATNVIEVYRPRTVKFDEFTGQARMELDEAMELNRFLRPNKSLWSCP